ncbi:MAG: biotin/lipoyl-containing protein, partial [Acidimicrobiales bacterium]
MADITMPQLGETVTEGTITKWHKQVGEVVAEDEVLFEVSTDKVDSEVPSPISGTVTEILVQEGQTVSVGAKLAVIGDRADRPAVDGTAGAPASESTEAADFEPAAVGSETGGAEAGGGEAGGGTRRGQAQAPVKPPTGSPARPGARPADQRPPSGPAQGSPSKLLSPVVRRLIAEHGLDPAAIPGSGLGGRITRDDVLAAVERQGPNGSGA